MRIGVFIFSILLPVNAYAQTAREWESKFKSTKPEVRQEAYQALESVDADTKKTALKALEKVHKTRVKNQERIWKKLAEVFPKYGSLGDKGMPKLLGTWLRARKAAYDIVFDKVQYPTPADGHAAGPEQGYDLVKPRLVEAKRAFGPIQGLAKKAFQNVLRGKWYRDLDKLKTDAKEIAHVNGILGREEEAPSVDFFEALALLGKKKFTEAGSLYTGGRFTQTQKILYFLILGQMIDHYNNRVIRHGMDAKSMKAVNTINLYRMMIGVLPYEADPILTKAITGHMADIDGGKTPFGHMSNVPGKRSVRDRCTKAGWKGGAMENLSRGGPMESVETGWFWDGGHGRNQVDPKFEKIGFGSGGQGCGFNNGYGGDNVVSRVPSPF